MKHVDKVAAYAHHVLNDAVAEWVFLIDRDGLILDVNAATAKRMRSTVEALRGRSIHEHSPHEARAARQERIEEACRTRQPCQHVQLVFGRWISTTIQPLLDEAGEVVQLAVLGYDITEWKHAEQELSLAASSYRSLFEQVPVGLYRTTPAGKILDANPALARMLGYADSQALRGLAAPSFFVNPADRARETAMLRQDGLVRDFTMQLRRIDGTIIWAQDNVRALSAPNGEIICFEGSLLDITEKVVADQALRRQTARSEALARTAARLNRQLALPELLQSVCEEAVESLGISTALVSVYEPATDRLVYAAGHNMPDEYVRRRIAPARDSYRQIEYAAGQLYVEDIRNAPTLPNGALLLELDAYTIAGATIIFRDEVIGTLSVCSFGKPHPLDAGDLSLLRGLADQAAQAISNARLYASLQIKTQQAQDAAHDLEEANRELSRALQGKNEMLQNIAHELRNPLTSIAGYAYLMEEGSLGPLTDEQLQAVAMVGRQAERVHSMLQRMLTLQTVTPEVLQRVEVDLSAFLEQTVDAWRVRSSNMQATRFELDTQAGLPTLAADAQLLGQVLDNLLENAVKFSPNGGAITIRAHQAPVSSAIRISISDEGIGIPADKLELVFDRFCQLGEAASLRVGGVGVGLALCRAIVEAHGGRAWAESAGPGKGSVFHVELPTV